MLDVVFLVDGAVGWVLMDVAQRQEGVAAVFSEELGAIESGLSWCPEVAGYIPEALNRMMNTQKENVRAVSSHISAGITGVGNATIAYDQVQEEMAGNFEREMLNSAISGDFSYSEAHGYKGGGCRVRTPRWMRPV